MDDDIDENEDFEDSDEEIEEENEETEEIEDEPKMRFNAVLENSNKSQYYTIVPPDERISSDVLSATEAAQILSIRAAQIEKNPIHYSTVAIARKCANPFHIAYYELYERKTPLLIQRIIGYTSSNSPIIEIWNPRSMHLPNIPPPDSK